MSSNAPVLTREIDGVHVPMIAVFDYHDEAPRPVGEEILVEYQQAADFLQQSIDLARALADDHLIGRAMKCRRSGWPTSTKY